MKGFKSNIENDTLDNTNFRKVVYTGKHLQLVLIIDETEYEVKDGDVIIVPAGAKHNVINTDSKAELKIYTLYSPPNHKDGTIRATKEDAEKKKEEFDGKTTE